jgi:hypothetical protein
MGLDWRRPGGDEPALVAGSMLVGLESATKPTLADMTTKALQLLDARLRGSQPGFLWPRSAVDQSGVNGACLLPRSRRRFESSANGDRAHECTELSPFG